MNELNANELTIPMTYHDLEWQTLMYDYDKINVGDIYEPKHHIERYPYKYGFYGSESVFACKIKSKHEGKVIRHKDYYEEVCEGDLYDFNGNPIDMHYDPSKIEKTYFIGVEYYGHDFRTISTEKIEIHEFLDNFKLNNDLFKEENNRRKKLNVGLGFLRLLYVLFVITWYPIIFPFVALMVFLTPVALPLTYIFIGECKCVNIDLACWLIVDFPKLLKPHENYITSDEK